MFEKKQRYSICMDAKVHAKITKFVKVNNKRSFSDFLAQAAGVEMLRINAEKKARRSQKRLTKDMGRIG